MKILLADDHKLMLEGIQRAFEEAEGMTVVATASAGPEAVSLVARHRPDVALLDIRMPGMDGLECLDQITKRYPDVKVVMLSSFNDRHHIGEALRRGACAYIVKSVDPRDLPAAVRMACEETLFLAVSVDSCAADSAQRDTDLTDRELAMLAAVARGLSNKAISKEFWVTEQTVKFHLNNVYRKFGVDNRTAAVRYALEKGIIELESPVLQPA
jgi:DNA-binding NarL/FixJ family response regulator